MARAGAIAVGLATLAGLLLLMHHEGSSRLTPSARYARSTSVDDRAGLLSSVQRASIAEYHAALREAHDIDFRVLAEATHEDINLRAHGYFETAGVGDLSRSGRGLLLVIDTSLDRVRLEVSTSLEGVYTDAFVAYVENRQMVPFFGSARVVDGILAATELIAARAQDAEAGRAFAPPMPARSMGGGATVTAGIGQPVAAPAASFSRAPDAAAHVNGSGPLAVIDAYFRAMAARDGRHDLPIYSSATLRMLEDRIMTPAQMDNVARTYGSCRIEDVRLSGELAVVRYDVEDRRCAPFLLREERGAWRLDLAAMSRLIRFNHENQWHIQPPLAGPYAFAFGDWRFDRNGFPHPADD